MVFFLEVLFAVFLAGLRAVVFFVVFFLFIAKAESTSFTCEMADARAPLSRDQPATASST